MGYNTIDDYLADVPSDSRKALEKLRGQIHAAMPGLTETISYQMPSFKVKGNLIAGCAAYKNHYSLMPMSGSVTEKLAAELAGYTVTKGTIHFDYGSEVPDGLLKLVLQTRLTEIEAALAAKR